MTARILSVKPDGVLPGPAGNGGVVGLGDGEGTDGITVGDAGIDDVGSPVWGTGNLGADGCER